MNVRIVKEKNEWKMIFETSVSTSFDSAQEPPLNDRNAAETPNRLLTGNETNAQLIAIAKDLGLKVSNSDTKAQLIAKIESGANR